MRQQNAAIGRDTNTALQILQLVTGLSGGRGYPAEGTSEPDGDKVMLVSPAVIGGSRTEITALIILEE